MNDFLGKSICVINDKKKYEEESQHATGEFFILGAACFDAQDCSFLSVYLNFKIGEETVLMKSLKGETYHDCRIYQKLTIDVKIMSL